MVEDEHEQVQLKKYSNSQVIVDADVKEDQVGFSRPT